MKKGKEKFIHNNKVTNFLRTRIGNKSVIYLESFVDLSISTPQKVIIV